MSNFDKAVEIMGELATEYGQPGGDELFGLDEDAALALKENGLLAPDLPEANDPGIFVPGGKGWRIGDISVWTAPDSSVMIQNVEPGDLSPAEARELAHALLAASDYAEREQDNE